MSDQTSPAEWPTNPPPIDGLVFRVDPPDVFTVPGSMVGPQLALPEVEQDPGDMTQKPESWTVMRWLEERRVCVFAKVEDGFVAAEKCDNFFDAPLTREHLLQLADELKQLAEDA